MQNNNYDKKLLGLMRALRDEIIEDWDMDDPVVYSDEQLEMLCRACPLTEDEFIRAMFDWTRFQWYGDAFTCLIRDYLTDSAPDCKPPLMCHVRDTPVIMSELLKPVNKVRQEHGLGKIEAKTVTQVLLNLGYLEDKKQKQRLPTEQGRDIGILVINRPDYQMAGYSPSAQFFVLQLLVKKGLMPGVC